MSFKPHLKILVMCITLSVLMKISSVGGLDCPGGFDPGSQASCIQDVQGYTRYNCPYETCGHTGNKWVWMFNCVPYPDGSGFSNQQCEKYNYLRPGLYTCENHGGYTYQCLHKLGDRPVISCENCTKR
ncbi:uncharacterized protein MELLADRAFT_123834 [Melampsora larici-populina 98AG31]|uniref:Secreted protein n=1 Tax=Melampsora larici-populina (strain 98AG31 / pathotype 3-4-7) TaxID=747676 RepID=F4RNB2_MELLP|nr:uncharacterized protein MELLADRAFT_123834 [Melampsora larici-populina 98AG31]EGG05958.1 secreted protein [Melampsora larici-populina 98AG31]